MPLTILLSSLATSVGKSPSASAFAYISQFIGMYAKSFGDWSRLLIAFIAFLCIFGTVITVIDGYSRANDETLRILLGKSESSQRSLNIWMTVTSVIGIVIVYLFSGNVATMLRFAMIASFLTTPIFAYLNYSLVNNKEHRISGWLKNLSILGLIYLFGFAFFFLFAMLTGKV
jgi:Mn2+/Fe2+ NRAMP family transporter